MSIAFTKMQAQGNDFIILNGLTTTLPELTDKFVRKITERRYGIGCDQLLALTSHTDADAHMAIFNNDGSEAANCGNGLRCVGHFLMQHLNKKSVSIALNDRIVIASQGEQGVRVDMGAAIITGQTDAHVDVEIGNSHSVFFEATERFPDDRNIEIVTGQVADHVYIDIIERGAGRTLACGSGACATAVAVWYKEDHQRALTIEMPGGIVQVSGSSEQVLLEGTVSSIFHGEFLLSDC